MASPTLILFPADAVTGEPWRLGRRVEGQPRVDRLPVGMDAAPAAVAVAVAAVGRGPVTVALPSSACLSATVETDGRFRGGWRSALLYRLELALPLAAEDVAADFLPHPRRPTALGVAVAIDGVRPLIDALESAGVAVAAVCPAALLAIDAAKVHDGLVAWCHGSAVDLIAMDGGQPTAWLTCPAEADDVRLYLPAVDATAPTLFDVPEGVASVIGGTRASLDWATAATSTVLAGRRPRVDLARGGLAPRGRSAAMRRWVVQIVVAASVLAACACGGTLWRAQQYQRIADDQLDRQQQLFHQLFPGRAAPADVRGRLASEARSLAGGSADHPAGGTPALAVLHGLLAHLPADVRFRLTEVRVSDGTVYAEGTVPTRSDADALATAVREGTGVAVDTPQTQQDGPRAVHFTLGGSTATDRGGT